MSISFGIGITKGGMIHRVPMMAAATMAATKKTMDRDVPRWIVTWKIHTGPCWDSSNTGHKM